MNTNYEYDGMSRLTRLKDVSSTATLFDRQYSYNTANQISQIVEPSLSRVFGYDNIDRLTSASGGATENYVFDGVGNRTSSYRSSTYGYQPFNKLTTTQTATYGSDANGNMVSKSEGSNFWRYTWDYENRMAEAATRKQRVRYRYDALGRRVTRNLGGGKELTKFTYDGQDVLQDDNAGTLTKYLNGEGIDNKLRATTGSNTNYFLADHLGSTNGLTNSSGGLSSSNSYDSFGNPTNTSFPSRYQFTGREFDSFTGLQFSRARFYDPNLGRFMSEDPIGFGGGDVNWYAYVHNNPLMYFDPEGTQIRSDSRYQPYSPDDNRRMVQHVRGMPVAKPDMCGPAGWPTISWLVPDSVGGKFGPFGNKFDISGPCETHDKCYASCGKSKEECDLGIKTDIEDVCEKVGGPYVEQCRGYADTYHKGVSDYYPGRLGIPWRPGQEAFDTAQQENGCALCVLPPPPRDPCSKFGDWRCK